MPHTLNHDISDLELAWHRLKLDRPDRCFVIHPYIFEWVERDLHSWLKLIDQELNNGYKPADCLTSYVPKPGWMVRPGAVLEIKDEVVFNLILGRFHSRIWSTIEWSQGGPDVAYQLRGQLDNADWIRSGFLIWKEWREKSLAKLQKEVQCVLFADIAGFYENIDFSRLFSDLNALKVERPWLELLTTCLNRWSQPRGKGIPQGHTASDILAKLYMNPVDNGLRNAGFTHLRYVDDIRIFCKSELEAKRALLKLNDLLRNRGLNLQSAKTEILQIGKAKKKIDGVNPIVQAIHKELGQELQEVYKAAGPYATLGDIDRILKLQPDTPPPAVLERAFRKYFKVPARKKFEQTLFHYLLTRLGHTKSRVAVGYCLSLLSKRPEETEQILKYLNAIDTTPKDLSMILDYAGSIEAMYDYQLYQIVRWFFNRQEFPQQLIHLCRKWAFDKNREPCLRTYSLALLGIAGDHSDLEVIEINYVSVTTGIEKAEVISALARTEINRRNSFFGRVQADGILVHRAIERVKALEKNRK